MARSRLAISGRAIDAEPPSLAECGVELMRPKAAWAADAATSGSHPVTEAITSAHTPT